MENNNVLIMDHVSFKYSPDTAYEVTALDDVSLTIKEGEFIGIIGHTGSGKSTLVQHLNGLMKATSGSIYFRGQDIYDKDYDIKGLTYTGREWFSSTQSISFSSVQFLMM